MDSKIEHFLDHNIGHHRCKMDSKIEHFLDHNIGHHRLEGHEDEHHHEKKSVMKKVKEKAKKIKDTIKKHGHGHDHDHGHEYGHDYHHVGADHDLDEEDDEDEEMVEDPEVHEYGSADTMGPVIEQVRNADYAWQDKANLGRATATEGDILAPTDKTPKFYAGNYETSATDPTKGKPTVKFGNTTIMGECLNPPNTSQSYDIPKITDPTGTNVNERDVNLGRPRDLEEDPNEPKDTPGAYTSSNYQSKVTDPTGRGRQAIGITPILHSLRKMNIYDHEPGSKSKPEQKQNILTGSHDQLSPDPTEESLGTGAADGKAGQNKSSYTDKISSATSAIADKAITAKNAAVSKLGYGEKERDDNTAARHEMEDKALSKVISETLHERRQESDE